MDLETSLSNIKDTDLLMTLIELMAEIWKGTTSEGLKYLNFEVSLKLASLAKRTKMQIKLLLLD